MSEENLPEPGVCGSSVENRILGGVEAGIAEYPWMTLLEYSKRNLNVKFPLQSILFHCIYL